MCVCVCVCVCVEFAECVVQAECDGADVVQEAGVCVCVEFAECSVSPRKCLKVRWQDLRSDIRRTTYRP